MEWTKEQGEIASEQLTARQEDDPRIFRIGGYRHEAWAIKLQLELTAALDEAQRLRSQLAKDDVLMGELAVSSGKQVERLIEAINWACGCGCENYETEFSEPDGAPRYWWRKHLTEIAGLIWDREKLRYVPAPPSGEQAAPKVGVYVACTECGLQKKPRGRSGPPVPMCDDGCPGYQKEPRIGDLWPGESEADFGYPVSADGTEVQDPKGEV